ncbi:hypothetical protein C7121_10050 [Paenibacillus glucanolyticus]|jgi:hypothetical protein|uniref:hypothetical protein n=1 Tax=Paenibacillus TaxID=44249 RepID=UPI0003E2361B|nr:MULTISPECIES: hypothetical protein [Paenibacillus]ANA79606.1 hypothetical protein A3958_06245 [Paenibacillus glucanolyticus]AVV56445.1 hypothetical protein C7121_10050 [Paenibacillus glucanolyticus]ETT31288.1 hypothetical protein C169_25633 [Paenibacillus sp. FSL R5-808]MPY19814.1 hypothetical protein [Paenibacillus glucanolyticus]
MTIKNTLTLRNLYFFLCIVLLLLIGYKGVHIYQKIQTMAQAERLYVQKKLVQAEEWYQKASRNHSLLYKEALLASRLQELAPITSMKQNLSSLDQRLNQVGEAGDFSAFMNVYAELLDAEEKLKGHQGSYALYYDEIVAFYGIPDDVKRIFLQFIGLFNRQADEQLEELQYDDNSFKWNLLRIPDSFYGGEKQKDEKLLSLFQRYDETVMTRLAGAGHYAELLNWSHAISSEYASRSVKAAWVSGKTDELVLAMLQKDAQRERPADFVSHAKGYRDYLNRSNQQNSDMLEYIQNQINRLILAADEMVAEQNYEEAVALYEALSGYQDMSRPLQAAKLAWTIHDPIRLFNMANIQGSFSYVSGGGKRFGGLAYAIGVDEGNIIYLAVLNADESVQLFQNHDFPSEIAIRQVSIEESLSTETNPVVLVEGGTGTDLVWYSAYEARASNLIPLFQFTAESYQILPDKSLLVTNFEGASPEEIAIFERQGDQYGFTGFQPNYTDIDIADIKSHRNKKVRFTINILAGGYGEALAERDGHYVILRGELDFPAGSASIIGTFSEYQQMEIPGSQDPPASDPTEPEDIPAEGDSTEETDIPGDSVPTEVINPEDTQPDNSESRDSTETPKLTQVPVIQVESIE